MLLIAGGAKETKKDPYNPRQKKKDIYGLMMKRTTQELKELTNPTRTDEVPRNAQSADQVNIEK